MPSLIYSFFDTVNENRGKCKTCNTFLRICGTSPLIRHLRNSHPYLYQKFTNGVPFQDAVNKNNDVQIISPKSVSSDKNEKTGGPRFIIIELKMKTDAMTLVQLMIDEGFYSNMVLIDDLKKHPSVKNQSNETNSELNTMASSSEHFTTNNATPRSFQSNRNGNNEGPRFLVIELKKKTDAMNLVQLMIENGFYSNMMLVDELEKHPLFENQCNETNSELVSLASSSEHYTPNDTIVSPLTVEMKPICEIDYFTQNDTNMLLSGFQNDSEEFTPNVEWLENLNSEETENSVNNTESSNKNKENEKESGTLTGKQDCSHYECQLCHNRLKIPRRGNWSFQLHVIAIHSKHRTMKCPYCTYEDYKKQTMRKHIWKIHNSKSDPVNIITQEKRMEWDSMFAACFPQYNDRSGFLENGLI